MMEREQFTFYGSFYRAMRRITDKAARADMFDCLCQYALYQQMPDLDNMAAEATILFEMAKPVLDTAREKAFNGRAGGSKPKANGKQTESKPEAKRKQTESKKEKEVEKENEIEIEDECQAAFDRFWEVYPRKVKKQDAFRAFLKLDVSLDVLLQALEKQKKNPQWLEDGGRFVPYPASWLNERRWEDEVTAFETTGGVPMGRAEMDDTEFGDMARAMRNAK